MGIKSITAFQLAPFPGFSRHLKCEAQIWPLPCPVPFSVVSLRQSQHCSMNTGSACFIEPHRSCMLFFLNINLKARPSISKITTHFIVILALLWSSGKKPCVPDCARSSAHPSLPFPTRLLKLDNPTKPFFATPAPSEPCCCAFSHTDSLTWKYLFTCFGLTQFLRLSPT